MGLANQMSALSALQVLNSVSAANTAAATSGWIQVSGYEDEIGVLISTGVITGTITYTFQTASDGSGTGAASITPLGGALTQLTTSNDDGTPYLALFDVRALKGYLKVIGTIVTGPAPVSYTIIGRKKEV